MPIQHSQPTCCPSSCCFLSLSSTSHGGAKGSEEAGPAPRGSWEEVTRGHRNAGGGEQVLPASPFPVTVLEQAISWQPRGPAGP